MVSFRELLRRLKEHDVEFVIIGGIAARLLGSPILTEDLDVCAPLDDTNMTRILDALRDLHPTWRFRPDKKIPVESLERFSGFKNLYINTDAGIIDILGELPGVGSFDQIKGRTVEIDLGDLPCLVLDLETLIAAKLFAGREKDRIAVDHLRVVQRQQANDGKNAPPPPKP